VNRDTAVVEAAERRARQIVLEAEQEAFRILEQAATVAFKGSRARRGISVGTKALALSSFGLAMAAVVEIALGHV
jgi:hypothetical protein